MRHYSMRQLCEPGAKLTRTGKLKLVHYLCQYIIYLLTKAVSMYDFS